MINNLQVMSSKNTTHQGFHPMDNATVTTSLPRFGRDYDHFDRKVDSAPSLPAKVGAMAERFMATTVPNLTLDDVEDLTSRNLQSLGKVKGIIFDLDDTLMPILSGKFPEKVIKTLRILHKEGFKMGVVTNNMQPEYCRLAREQLRAAGLDLPFIEDAHKPDTRGFNDMRKHFGLPASQVAVVGDGYICDIRCANLLGMVSIQAGWFAKGACATTASYALDTVAALFQTVRAYMHNSTHPPIRHAGTEL